MTLANESIRFYVGRINVETKQEQVLHFNEYNNLFTTSEEFSQSNGFKEQATANKASNWLNLMEKEIARDKARNIKWHYFTYRKDDKVTTLANYPIPEQEPAE